MIDWAKIVESHVIRTFRKICYEWWGIDVWFCDEQNEHSAAIVSFQNPVCNFMHLIPKGVKCCSRTYLENLKKFRKKREPLFYQCFAGLQGLAFPLLVKQKYVGAMIGSGICTFENRASLQKKFEATFEEPGFDRMVLDSCYNKLKRIDQHKKEYLLDFMKIIAEDVVAHYEYLQGKDGDAKTQPLLLEGLYKEKYKGIIGTSPAIKRVFDILGLVERSESPVLVEGESGTGKELIAAAIHYNSPRKEKTFVIQNCSVFSDTLLNSELFGHEKGSFTGAQSEKKGLFEIADKGTLFLDEIGDMNREIQARLLRVLEDGSFYRVGGTEPKKVNVRIIAATNKNLKELVEGGLFRKDLFYRINTIHVVLPPLKERKEDIASLADYFLDHHANSCVGGKKEMHPSVRELLHAYHWPGNVRELKNLVERLVLLSGTSKIIEVQHIPREILAEIHPGLAARSHAKSAKLAYALKMVEKAMICEELKKANGNKTYAARALGISRASLNNKIAEFK